MAPRSQILPMDVVGEAVVQWFLEDKPLPEDLNGSSLQMLVHALCLWFVHFMNSLGSFVKRVLLIWIPVRLALNLCTSEMLLIWCSGHLIIKSARGYTASSSCIWIRCAATKSSGSDMRQRCTNFVRVPCCASRLNYQLWVLCPIQTCERLAMYSIHLLRAFPFPPQTREEKLDLKEYTAKHNRPMDSATVDSVLHQLQCCLNSSVTWY